MTTDLKHQSKKAPFDLKPLFLHFFTPPVRPMWLCSAMREMIGLGTFAPLWLQLDFILIKETECQLASRNRDREETREVGDV